MRIRSWRRKAPTASNTELDVKVLSDCDVLLRSSHTKDGGIMSEMPLLCEYRVLPPAEQFRGFPQAERRGGTE